MIRLVYINVDDAVDPLYELGRLLPLQFAMSYGGKRAPLVREGKIREAYELSEKLAKWTPRNPAAHMHVGFLAYLLEDKKRAVEAFTKAHELNPNFKQDWDTILQSQDGAAYKKILADREFVSKILQ